MANAGLTQAQFDKVSLRLGFVISLLRAAREMRNRFRRSSVRTIEVKDYNANFATPPVLTGVKLGTNTNANGEIIWRVTGAGPYTVKGYTATGGSGEVCTGSAAANATVTLAASNSSGLTGTILLAASVTAENDDKHRTACFPDFPLQVPPIFDGTETRDGGARAAIEAALGQMADQAAQIESLALGLLGTIMRTYVGPTVQVGSPNGSLLSPIITADGSGALSASITGTAEELRTNMKDNTTVQYVVQAAPSAGSRTYETGNVGQGTIASPTLYQHAKAGLVIIRCTDGTVGAEKFQVTLQPTDLSDVITAANPLTVGQVFVDQKIGIASMTLVRTFSKTGDGTNVDFAVATGATVSGLTPSNSSGGSFGVKITANGGNWDVAFYKTTSGFATGDIVAQATAVAAGAAFQATAVNRSGLTINWTVGSAPTTAHTATLNCQCFQSSPLADRISFTITSTSPGKWQEAWSEFVRWYLNSTTSGSETWAEGLVTRGGAVFATWGT